MYSKHVFAIWTPLGIISVIETTALLKLEIQYPPSGFHSSPFSVTEDNLLFEIGLSGPPFSFECFHCS